jgi:formate hydrogenlyase transcriptional activator
MKRMKKYSSGMDSNIPEQINERLRFETMLSDLSTRFVNLSADQIDQEIEQCLKRIAETLNIDRCSVAQLNNDKTELRVTHAYAASGITPMPGIVLNKQQPWYSQRLFRCESIVMSSIEELPKEAEVEKRHCIEQGIKSSALIPLVVSGKFLGVVGFASLRAERQWPEVLVQRIKLVGVVFANALMRKDSEKKLHRAFNEIKRLKDRLEAENTYLREEVCLQPSDDDLLGDSSVLKAVLKRAKQVANTDSTVLILGETGTGKELLAKAIHNMSQRKKHHMITLNCAALPSNLVESELFGHEKGAFTGADSKRMGRFELANESSLFLDEIGELSLELQAKLLRILQSRKFERLGGGKTIESNVRVIAATNRDLLHSVQIGEFRMDLYYRLNVFPIVIPPLRNRREDIPVLVWHFVRNFSEKMGKRIETISDNSMLALQSYSWPGNVRELKNIIERAMITSSGRTLQIELPEFQTVLSHETSTLLEFEKAHVLKIMKMTDWRVRGRRGAAELLGLKPTTLEARLKKMGIRRPS